MGGALGRLAAEGRPTRGRALRRRRLSKPPFQPSGQERVEPRGDTPVMLEPAGEVSGAPLRAGAGHTFGAA